MNRNPRNQSLLARLSETNPFRETLAPRAFDIGRDFEKAVEDVGLDGRLSPQGKREKAQGHLAKARSDLLELQKPIDQYRAQTASLRSGMKKPVYDQAGALDRWKIRDRALTMTFGQNAMRLVGPKRSRVFVDAVLEFEDDPWLGGIDVDDPNERELYEEAKQSRSRDLNPELTVALEARASVESEVMMIVNMVRNDLESAASDLASRAA